MPSTAIRQNVVRNARNIVVKVGTSALTDDRGRLDVAYLADLAEQVAGVVRSGVGATLVSSGAIGAGMAELDLPERPRTLPLLQATAAVGQGQLMRHFHDAFGRFGVKVAQILVTRGDFEDRVRYLNIRNTIAALREYYAVAVINENDTVAVDELPGGVPGKFGDNDIIAALVTNMLRADLLVVLSVVDGVLEGGRALDIIESDSAAAARLVTGERSRLGTGGMGSKLKAVNMVAAAGEVAIIANAREPNILPRLLAGEKLGTVIVPAAGKMDSRRRWIAQAARAAGKILVDAGAAKALTEGGKSLLPSGISVVEGKFSAGATVAIITAGREIARGLTNYSSDQIEKIKGLKSSQIAKVLGHKPYDEVVHRNNMTLA